MNKTGLTLMELLAVVVIIGVLAAVVQPKFNKVVEAYKVLEAEHIMAAVRNEQTARCTLDKDYTVNPRKLTSLPAYGGKHFAYGLTATGIVAANLTKDYKLVMKSYDHGGFCCQSQNGEGSGYCDSLLRKYPLCSEYNVTDRSGCAAN